MSNIKYYTPNEVALHVTTDDLWVSLFGKVLDLSPLCKDEDDDSSFAFLSFAGKDISHLFDEHGEAKLYVNPNTNKIDTFLPFKPFPDVPSQTEAASLHLSRKERDEKISEAFIQKYICQRLGKKHEIPKSFQSQLDKQQKTEADTPWFKDEKYVIGLLTRKPRRVKIMNTMIMKEVVLEVCSEDTIEDILERYLKFNRHVRSYTWKYFGEELNMKQTLEENGIPDEDEKTDKLRLNSDDFIPSLYLYFNHDLTEM